MENSAKAKTIELLQQTIVELQTIVANLSQPAPSKFPSLQEVETLLDSTQKLAAQVAPAPASSPSVQTRLQPEPEEIVTPPSQFSLPRPLLIALGTGVLVVLIATSILLKSPSPTPETTIVEKPSPIAVSPEPVSLPTPTLPPAQPKLEISPEQGLIAAIQTEVAKITEKYAPGLVESVEANFVEGRLIIQVSPDWLQLSPSEQQKVANQILASSRHLDFRKLELRDREANLLARSPVVGENMVLVPS